jgi:hypothetical protein
MKTKNFIKFFIMVAVLTGCKKELDVKNPNQPTPASAITESGIISLAQGTILYNGFVGVKYGDGIYGPFWSGAVGFHEMMGDVVLAEAANAYINQIGAPEKVTYGDGTSRANPNSPNTQRGLFKLANSNSNLGSNPLYYEWAFMYNMVNGANNTLATVADTKFSGTAATKKSIIEAWAYFWKGYAYARIGSIYYAGIINNEVSGTNGNYVTKEKIMDESNANFDKAITILNSLTSSTEYNNFLGRLIPSSSQVGNGGILSPTMWIHNINTLKARNILVNTTVTQMTSTQWAAILALTNAGITATDKIFTGRSDANGDFIGSTVTAKVQHPAAGGNTYKLSERWVQDFKTGDKRFDNNVKQTAAWVGNSDRGNSFNTRFTLVNGGAGLAGVIVYANTALGGLETVLGGNYEENELMKAEAKIYTNDISGALVSIDAVRTRQGAGLAPLVGTILTLVQAKEELRRERRIALPFRGLSFYDARRWNVIKSVSQGGGRTGAIVLKIDGTVSTNSTIDYNFIDYYDVPDNELAYNPAATGSAPVVNPNN